MPTAMRYRVSNPVAHIEVLLELLGKGGEWAATSEEDFGAVFGVRVAQPIQIPTVPDDEVSGDPVGSDGRAWVNVRVARGQALLVDQQTYEQVLEEGLKRGDDVQEKRFVNALDIAADHGTTKKQPLYALPRSIKASQSLMELFGQP